MENISLIIILFAVLGFFSWIVFYFTKKHFKENTSNLSGLSEKMLSQLNEVTNQVNLRLRENLEMMQRQGQDLNSRLDNTQRVVQSVTNKLTGLEESSKKIFEVGKDISSLHDILRAPKLRGGLGEYFLADILEQILPRENYSLQYGFRDGEKVDAVVRLRDMMIPVDSKFPLENFKQIIASKTHEEKISTKKQFMRDVKKHVDSIAEKYIRPAEGTSDFALMYVPAENVYYEIILKEKESSNITSYALSKKVIPVSPNSFYAYLQAILIGLKGLQIEKGAKEILVNLSRLKNDFGKFAEDFDLLGKHLNHANSTYESGQKRLEKFNNNLIAIESSEKTKKLPTKDS
jgi:DNA recombination protein RmuC